MRSVLIIVLATGVASADDPPDSTEPTELHEGLTREATGPLLHIETALRPAAEGFDADVRREQVDLDLGPRTYAQFESSAYARFEDGMPKGWTTSLFNSEGWSTTLRMVHDFKVIQVGAEASYNRVDSAYAHGSYAFVGASLTRMRKLSRWMTGWISLSLGYTYWLGGQPPPGERNGAAGMLTIGTTFR
ncbi:MAG TPA: hypothetical protein VFV99_18535 [Kofleriaceae bacterium]|nr:hypothetical protein [Kofleriaceae bacterium]